MSEYAGKGLGNSNSELLTKEGSETGFSLPKLEAAGSGHHIK